MKKRHICVLKVETNFFHQCISTPLLEVNVEVILDTSSSGVVEREFTEFYLLSHSFRAFEQTNVFCHLPQSPLFVLPNSYIC